MIIEKPKRMPLYLQLKDLLLEQIESGDFPPGSYLPPERELANTYDVSRVTVRKALKELQAGGFVKREQGRGTRIALSDEEEGRRPGNKENLLGFVFGWGTKTLYSAPYYSPIYRAVEQSAIQNGKRVFVVSEAMARSEIDSDWLATHFGGLFVAEGVSPELTSELTTENLPVVLLNCSVKEGRNASSIVVDNVRAAREAVRYLIGLGHEKIGFLSEQVSGNETEVFLERQDGWRSALMRNSIKPDTYLIQKGTIEGYEVPSTLGGYRAMQKLLAIDAELPTAVFACNDLIAIGAIDAIQEAGLDVPGDISVMGFDDIEDAANTSPPLSTVRVDLEQMGKLAYRKLESMMTSASSSEREELLMNTQIVERGSTMRRSGSNGKSTAAAGTARTSESTP